MVLMCRALFARFESCEIVVTENIAKSCQWNISMSALRNDAFTVYNKFACHVKWKNVKTGKTRFKIFQNPYFFKKTAKWEKAHYFFYKKAKTQIFEDFSFWPFFEK